jgi:hypothetical protein
MSAATTCMPRLAQACASASPIPLPAPVITATCPAFSFTVQAPVEKVFNGL